MATKKPTTAVVKWADELAKQAVVAAAVEESTSTGAFFSLKSGILSFGGNPVPNNEMAVVVVDSVLENVFYGSEYDPDNIESPICFAFGRDEKTIEPHKIVVEAGNSEAGASGQCAGCPNNEWGSADRGRGKACANKRRVAMIPAGTIEGGKFKAFTKPEQFETSAIAFMKLPVTSVKGYATYVKQIAAGLKRPPHGIFTKVSVRPDPQSQFKVVFEPLAEVPDELMGAVMARHKEAVATIETPYSVPSDEPKAAPAGRGAKAPKDAAKGKARY